METFSSDIFPHLRTIAEGQEDAKMQTPSNLHLIRCQSFDSLHSLRRFFFKDDFATLLRQLGIIWVRSKKPSGDSSLISFVLITKVLHT